MATAESDLVMVEWKRRHHEHLARQRDGISRPNSPSELETGLAQSLWPTSTATAGLIWLTADYNDNTVSMLLGNGNGTFRAKQAFGTGSGSASVAVGDFNGDGGSDLATTDADINTVSVLLGNATTDHDRDHRWPAANNRGEPGHARRRDGRSRLRSKTT